MSCSDRKDCEQEKAICKTIYINDTGTKYADGKYNVCWEGDEEFKIC